MPAAILAKAREKGLHESLRLIRDIARIRMAGLSRGEKQAFVFLSPPMGNSGAPHVLMQIIDEFASTYGSGSVRLLAPVVAPPMRDRAAAGGVSIERAVAVMGSTLVGLQLALRRDDFVLMNTVGVPRNYVSFILNSLRTERLAHA